MKNDGIFAKTRYFQCQPNCGLFAPVPKVNKIDVPFTTSVKAKAATVRCLMATISTSLKYSPSASSLSFMSFTASSVSSKPSLTGLHVLKLEVKLNQLLTMMEAVDRENGRAPHPTERGEKEG